MLIVCSSNAHRMLLTTLTQEYFHDRPMRYLLFTQNSNTALLSVNLLPSFPAARADPL